LTEYRDLYPALRAIDANMAAISVDAPAKSESVRRDLGLPFPILSDFQRKLVRQWDIYNAREKGGIAKPAVFILDTDLTVCFASVDQIASRVPASEILRQLSQQQFPNSTAARKTRIPGPRVFFRALGNAFRMGVTQLKDDH
jgi:peroxiredoxin